MTPMVAVVGSGPAGAIAAWACHLHGVQAHVYSNTAAPSSLPGAQYLHSPFLLPGDATVNSISITYAKLGTREGYAEKIYGADFDPASTSWDLFPAGERRGWPLRKIYEILFSRLNLRIAEIGRVEMLDLVRNYDVVFNSAPAALFARRDGTPVQVKTERVWIRHRDVLTDRADVPGLIVYEGDPKVPHYRYSFLEGRDSFEYPEDYDPGQGAVLVSKPLSIDRPPMDTKIVPIGRYGKWKKGVLVDSVFQEVCDVVQRFC